MDTTRAAIHVGKTPFDQGTDVEMALLEVSHEKERGITIGCRHGYNRT